MGCCNRTSLMCVEVLNNVILAEVNVYFGEARPSVVQILVFVFVFVTFVTACSIKLTTHGIYVALLKYINVIKAR